MLSTALVVSALLALQTCAQAPLPYNSTVTQGQQEPPVTSTFSLATSTSDTTVLTIVTTYSVNGSGSSIQTQLPESTTSLPVPSEYNAGSSSGGSSTTSTEAGRITTTISIGAGTSGTTDSFLTGTVPLSTTSVSSDPGANSTVSTDLPSQTTAPSSNASGNPTVETTSRTDSTGSSNDQPSSTSFITTAESSASQSDQQTSTSFPATTDSTGSPGEQQTSTSSPATTESIGSSSGQQMSTSSVANPASSASPSDQQTLTSNVTPFGPSATSTSTMFVTTPGSSGGSSDQQTATSVLTTASAGQDQTTSGGVSTSTNSTGPDPGLTTPSLTSEGLSSTTQQEVQITVNPELTITGNASEIIVGTTILSPGGPGFTSGTVSVSLAPDGVVVVGSSSTTLPLLTFLTTNDPPATSTNAPVQISVNPELTITGDASGIVIGASTLSPGGPGFTSGTISASLAPSGVVVVGGSTTTLPALSTDSQPLPTRSSQTISPSPAPLPSSPSPTSTLPGPIPPLTSPAPTTAPPGVPTVLPSPGSSSSTQSSTPDATDIQARKEALIIALQGTTPGFQEWVRGVDIDPKPIIEGLRTISNMADEILKRIPSSNKGIGCLDSLFGALHCIIDTGTKAINLISTGVKGQLQETLNTLIEITKVLPKLEVDGDDPEENPDEDEQTSTSSCSATTVSSCFVGCSESVTTAANSASLTTICYTTSCDTTTGCDLEPTTTSSVTTSSETSCPMTTEPYGAQLSADVFGTAIPVWPLWPDFGPLEDDPDSPTDATTIVSQTPSTSASLTTATSLTSPTSTVPFISPVTVPPPVSTSTTVSFDPPVTITPPASTSTTVPFDPPVTATPPASTTLTDPTIFTTTLPDFRGYDNLGEVVRKCHDVSKFHGHGDLHTKSVDIFAYNFCRENGKFYMTPYTDPFQMRYDSESLKLSGSKGVNNDFYVQWIPGCRLKNGDGEMVTRQMIDFKRYPETASEYDARTSACYSLLFTNYAKCNNEGVGGSVEAGCLKFTFTGGRGEAIKDYIDVIVPSLPP